jgi:threonine dehydrogenase-like Zn-dependent dehydrogenase
VLSATLIGAERIIAMSRHESRQTLARECGCMLCVLRLIATTFSFDR